MPRKYPKSLRTTWRNRRQLAQGSHGRSPADDVRRLTGWGAKNIEGRKATYADFQRPRVSRKVRINGTVEEMLPPKVIEWTC